jgi:anti-anti-sigma factor
MSVVDPGCMALTVDRQPEEPLRWASWASPPNAPVCSTLERPSGILSAVAPDPGGLVNDVRPGVSAMSVEQVGIRAGQRCPVTAACGTLADAAALCSCAAMSLVSSAGEIIVLRVAGEVDLSTLPVLQAALTGSLAREPRHLVVDLSGLIFCSVRGATLLVQAGRTAASHGTGYAVTAVPGQVIRVWLLLWPAGDLPIRYPTSAAGVRTAVAASPFTTALEVSL